MLPKDSAGPMSGSAHASRSALFYGLDENAGAVSSPSSVSTDGAGALDRFVVRLANGDEFDAVCSAVGGVRQLGVGFPSGVGTDAIHRACVYLKRGVDDPLVSLQWAGFDAACPRGGRMRRGDAGTVPMVRAALALALERLGGEGFELMDTSAIDVAMPRSPLDAANRTRRVARLHLADYFPVTRAKGSTWYEARFGAVIDARHEAQRAANARQLAAPLPRDAFARLWRTCFAPEDARLTGDSAWVAGIEPAVRDAVRRAAAAPGATWHALFVALDTDRLVGPPAFDLILRGLSGLLPLWRPMHGLRWTIPADAVLERASSAGHEVVRLEDAEAQPQAETTQRGGSCKGVRRTQQREWQWRDRVLGLVRGFECPVAVDKNARN